MLGGLDEHLHILWGFLGNLFETILFFITGGFVGTYLTAH